MTLSPMMNVTSSSAHRADDMKKLTNRIITSILLVLTVVATLWLLLAGWGGRIDPRTWAPPALAVLTYPVAVMVVLALAVVMAIVRRWWLLAALGVALLLTAPALRVNMPMHVWHHSDVDSSSTFKLLTFNAMGFYGDTDSTSSSMRYILDSDADLVVLQEAALEPPGFIDHPWVAPMREEIERKYPYYSKGYRDLVILSRWPYTVYPDSTLRQGSGSLDDGEYHFYGKMFDVHIPGHQLRVVDVHMQSIGLTDGDKRAYRDITRLDGVNNREQMQQVRSSVLTKLAGAFRRRANEAHRLREVMDLKAENLILCGDFNDVPASYAYWTIRGDDMRDVFAECGRGFTYTFNRDKMYFNIDHILYRGALRAVDIRRDKEGKSDHYPQIVTFEWQDTKE